MADSSADRDPLERLAEEFVARFCAGEDPSLDDYAARHPELAADIRELFPALVEMEQLKPSASGATDVFMPASPRASASSASCAAPAAAAWASSTRRCRNRSAGTSR